MPTRRAIMRSRFEVKRSKVKVTRLINVATESVSPTTFKLGRLLSTAIKACEKLGYCTRAEAYRVGRSREATQLVLSSKSIHKRCTTVCKLISILSNINIFMFLCSHNRTEATPVGEEWMCAPLTSGAKSSHDTPLVPSLPLQCTQAQYSL